MVLAPLALGLPRLAGRHRRRATSLGKASGTRCCWPSTGLVTAVPLLCFGAAAIRVPMTTLGLLQYLAPMLQFALGRAVLPRGDDPGRWVGFALVWVALVIFTVEALRHHRRRQLRLTAEACAI